MFASTAETVPGSPCLPGFTRITVRQENPISCCSAPRLAPAWTREQAPQMRLAIIICPARLEVLLFNYVLYFYVQYAKTNTRQMSHPGREFRRQQSSLQQNAEGADEGSNWGCPTRAWARPTAKTFLLESSLTAQCGSGSRRRPPGKSAPAYSGTGLICTEVGSEYKWDWERHLEVALMPTDGRWLGWASPAPVGLRLGSHLSWRGLGLGWDTCKKNQRQWSYRGVGMRGAFTKSFNRMGHWGLGCGVAYPVPAVNGYRTHVSAQESWSQASAAPHAELKGLPGL